jgi:hypothetical protein
MVGCCGVEKGAAAWAVMCDGRREQCYASSSCAHVTEVTLHHSQSCVWVAVCIATLYSFLQQLLYFRNKGCPTLCVVETKVVLLYMPSASVQMFMLAC